MAREHERNVSVVVDDTHCVVRFEGDLVAGSAPRLADVIDELGSVRCACVSVDLSAVTRWDELGEHVVMGLWSYLGGRGVRGDVREPRSGPMLTER